MYHHTFRTRQQPPLKMTGMANMRDMDMNGAKRHTQSVISMSAMPMSPQPGLDLATTFVWGRTRSLADNRKENSYLAEALLRFATRNYVWTRIENAARSNELELTPGTPLPPGFTESPIGHVAGFTFGYDRDFPLGPHILAAPGLQFTAYRTPLALHSVYGATPTAEQFFIRFRVR
jgi:hypothetical protein